MAGQLQELQQALYRLVPLSQHARVRIRSYDGQSIQLDAPLAENLNPSGNVFGGSLNVTLTLAGWCLTWFVVQEAGIQDAEIVIHDSTCKYRVPVTRDFSAHCYRPDIEQIERFKKLLRNRGKARLALQGNVMEEGHVAVTFTGRYAVCLKHCR